MQTSKNISYAVLANKIDNLIDLVGKLDARLTRMDLASQDVALKVQALETGRESLQEQIDGLKTRVTAWDVMNSIGGVILTSFVIWKKP